MTAEPPRVSVNPNPKEALRAQRENGINTRGVAVAVIGAGTAGLGARHEAELTEAYATSTAELITRGLAGSHT